MQISLSDQILSGSKDAVCNVISRSKILKIPSPTLSRINFPLTFAGDDSVNETITDLVRGPLASALKQMLEQGLRRTGLLTGSIHPWQFILEAANEVVQADYNSVFSRLVLCKTFK